MNQEERRSYLIRELLKEEPGYKRMRVPGEEAEQRKLLRSLMNVRFAAPVSSEFEQVENDYLREVNAQRGIVTLQDAEELQPELYLWQGDITRLQVDAIVNAANSGMTGCYVPCHSCIDNCIHTYAGIQLRNYCADMMEKQGHEEPTGQAKITPGFNLPCRYILHTVGPVVSGELTEEHERLLASCYRSCLELAEQNGVQSIAFCGISTGVFGFPKQRAAEIAVQTVKDYKASADSRIKVLFNAYKKPDADRYRELLTGVK